MLFYELRAVLDFTSLKLMDNDQAGVKLLSDLLLKFPDDQQTTELNEARELVAEL